MKTLLAASMLFAAMLDAHAMILVSGSLEWLADTSETIGVYTATSVDGHVSGSQTAYAMELKLAGPARDIVKGGTPGIWKLRSDGGVYSMAKEKALKPGDRLLVFARPDERGDLRVTHVISLSQPGGVFDSPRMLAMNAKLRPLTNGDEILRTVRDRIAAHPGIDPAPPARGQLTEWAMDISNTPAFDRPALTEAQAPGMSAEDRAALAHLRFGSYYLQLPADLSPRAIVKAREDLKRIVEALNAYYALHHAMPHGNNARIMKEMNDPGGPCERYLSGRLNATGEFADPWGNPYRIGVSNPGFPWAYSFGPGRVDDGGAPDSDDLVSWDR